MRFFIFPNYLTCSSISKCTRTKSCHTTPYTT